MGWEDLHFPNSLYSYRNKKVFLNLQLPHFLGPVFEKAFLGFRRKNWAKERDHFQFLKQESEMGTAGLENNILGFPKQSEFLHYLLSCLRENFPTVSSTLYKTGPYLIKEAFLQYPYRWNIPLIR